MSDDDTPKQDPFDALEESDGSDGTDDLDPETDAEDPFAALEEADDSEDAFAGLESAGGSANADPEDPFDALEDDEDLSDAFERMEVDELSEEDVWDALDGQEGLGDVASGATPDGTDHVVNKREYCQRCPHFSEPPETACTHEDGEILEVLEGNEFRVRNCPMVEDEGPRFDRS